MTLPVPSLDDRRFQDIVDEAKRRIPRAFPAWTDHNVSDPGVALIELFAWMTEMTLVRLNQLPERAMVTLLNTAGFQPLPARAARALLTFSTAGENVGRIVVPARTQIGSTSGGDGQVIFETEQHLAVEQPALERCLVEQTLAAGGVPAKYIERTSELTDDTPIVCFAGLASDPAGASVSASPRVRAGREAKIGERFDGDAIYFGFANSLANAVVQLVVTAHVAGLGIRTDEPPLIWEASTPRGFSTCERYDDTTMGLNSSGSLKLVIPADHCDERVDGHKLYWLRLRADTVTCERYQASPTITRPTFAAVGGVVWAAHAMTQPREELGCSDGKPGQRFRLSQRSILPLEHPDGLEVIDAEGKVDSGWSMGDFAGATAHDKVFTVNLVTGEIAFGPSVLDSAGRPTQHGAIPPEKTRIVMTGYRVGGGSRGNSAAGTVVNLRTSLRSIAGVTNRTPATGGLDAESYEQAMQRAPLVLRSGDRAVTSADHVRIVRDVRLDIARLDAREPRTSGQAFRLLVVPNVAVAPKDQNIDDYAITTDLAIAIERELEPRRLVGSRCLITTPYYLGVTVAMRVLAAPTAGTRHASGAAEPGGSLKERILGELYRYVNPVVGGPSSVGVRGVGLAYDTPLVAEQLEALVSAIDGVLKVADIELFRADARRELRCPGPGSRRIELPPDTLFMSFKHAVVVVEPNGTVRR